MAKKKQTPDELVASATPGKATVSWVTGLSDKDWAYVHDVVSAMKENPAASHTIVATKLIRELGIDRSVGTVTRTLKELVSND